MTEEDALTQIQKDLQSIKLIYLDNVLTSLNRISEDMSEHLNKTMVKIQDLFEKNTNFFIQLSEENKSISAGITTLKENQVDQPATIGQMRNVLESIVKIDLHNLKSSFGILRNEFQFSH